jgi:HK97 family phage prohead protease
MDKDKGIVTMYVNSFNNVDSDGDVSLPGSFNRTIKNNFKRIKHLFNHDRGEIIGLPLEFIPDNFGLKVISQLNLGIDKAKDVFANYKFFAENNRSLEHSIGARAVEFTNINEANGRYGWDVKEWQLIEYSTVAFGANELTPVVDIKSEMDIQKALTIVEKLSKMDYSDETKEQLERFYYAVLKYQRDGSPIFGSQNAPEVKAPGQIEKQTDFIKIIKQINF